MSADEREDYLHVTDLIEQADNLVDRAGQFEDLLQGPAIYLADINTGFRYAVGYRKEAFRQLELEVSQRNLAFQPRINALDTLMFKLATGKRDLNEASRRALIICGGLYVVGTRIFAVNEGRNAHYLVLRYPNAERGGHLLRPACATPNGALTADARESLIAQVLQMDRVFYPERFLSVRSAVPRLKP